MNCNKGKRKNSETDFFFLCINFFGREYILYMEICKRKKLINGEEEERESGIIMFIFKFDASRIS